MRLRPPLSFLFSKGSIIAVCIVLLSIIFLAVPVRAANPSVVHVNAGNAGPLHSIGTTCTAGMSNPGALTAVTFILELTVVATSTTASSFPSVSTITDTYGLTWTQISHVSTQQTSGSSGTQVNTIADVSLWYAASTGATTGTNTLTITLNNAGANCLFDFAYFNTLEYPVTSTVQSTGTVQSSAVTPISLSMVYPSVIVPSSSFVFVFSGINGGTATASPTLTYSGPVTNEPASVNTNTVGSTPNASPYCNDVGAGASQACVDSQDGGWTFYGAAGATAAITSLWQVSGGTAMVWTGYMIGVVFNPAGNVNSSTNQSTSIGSCPTKNTATFTMVNQTLYMYQGTTLVNEAVSTVQVNVASVGGTTGTHTIQLVIYATPSSGSISVSNLFTLVYSHQVALTSGSKNQQIILSVSGVNFANLGSIWGVGIVGDNKVALNQSSLTGAFSFAGVPVSTATQNAFFTTQGASFGTGLALCANALFQSVITQTVTVTQSATTSVTVTSTSTVNTINAQVLFASNQNWPIIFLLLFLPCGILLGATKNLSGGMVGLLIGSVICLMAGVIPAYIFTGLLIGIVAMMVLIQRSGPNG